MLRLAAALAPLPLLAGCLTAQLVSDAQQKTVSEARLTAIRGAALSVDTVVLQVAVRSPGALESKEVQFRVPATSIGQRGPADQGAYYTLGTLPAEAPPLMCYQEGEVRPISLARLPIRRLDVRDENALDRALEAVRFDSNLVGGARDRGIVDHLSLDRNTTPVLVRRLEGEAPRRLMVYGFRAETKGNGILYLLTPFTAIGDILTFPFQLIAVLSIEC
jgi:hypothetical protein